MDVDLRLVRYFTVVAEYGNFGRAATSLHLAQPSLSRQIQRLEAQLGVRLFDRSPQGSSLTGAGQAFLPRARILLQEAEQAARAARAAVQPPTVTVGCAEGLVITACVQELRRRHPDGQVRPGTSTGGTHAPSPRGGSTPSSRTGPCPSPRTASG